MSNNKSTLHKYHVTQFNDRMTNDSRRDARTCQITVCGYETNDKCHIDVESHKKPHTKKKPHKKPTYTTQNKTKQNKRTNKTNKNTKNNNNLKQKQSKTNKQTTTKSIFIDNCLYIYFVKYNAIGISRTLFSSLISYQSIFMI